MGVSDIRVIPAAQCDNKLINIKVAPKVLDTHPILKYRIENIKQGIPVRGIRETDSRRCGLAMDDMAVMGGNHYPCIIYMREGGAPIGPVGDGARQDRFTWSQSHNTHADPICKKNCLDVCVAYNNRFRELNPLGGL
jgi:hypothetical protein